MKAAVLEKYNQIIWQDVPDPKIKKGNEVLIKIKYAGICGSDQHVFKGEFHPRTHVPFIQGHEFAGTIIETGKSVTKFKTGDRVAVDPIIWCGKCAACQIHHYPACTSLKLIGIDQDGAFAEYVIAEEFQLFKIPDNITDRDAALIEVFAIGFHACKRAEVTENDTIAIWGGGRIGQCILQAAKTKTDKTIFIVDILDERLEIISKHFSNVVCINATKQNPIKVIKEKTGDRGVDIAFEAVGHAKSIPEMPNPIQCCIDSIRGAGKVTVLGLSDEPADLKIKQLIWKEGKIITSRVSHGEFGEAILHLSKGDLNPEALISAEFDASEAQKAFEMLEEEPGKYLKILLKLH